MAVALFVVAGVLALIDWAAVWQRWFRIEYVAKPATLALLIAATVSADLPHTKGWLVAGLAFGLVGDVALLVSADRPGKPDRAFLVGLTAFLVGHVCYLTAFVRHGVQGLSLVAGALILAGSAALVLPRILARARRVGGAELTASIGGYGAVLGAMTLLAVGTSSVATAIGGVLFLGSDALIAWDRFVARIVRAPLLVIVSYHLAQFLIVLGLVHRG